MSIIQAPFLIINMAVITDFLGFKFAKFKFEFFKRFKHLVRTLC